MKALSVIALLFYDNNETNITKYNDNRIICQASRYYGIVSPPDNQWTYSLIKLYKRSVTTTQYEKEMK